MARNIDESRWIGHGAEQEGFYGLLIGDIYLWCDFYGSMLVRTG